MGLLVDGKWKTDWYESDKDGSFKRPQTQFRHVVDEAGTEGFVVEPGRYHLYVSYACPWAHRVLITRALKGLEDAIGVSVVHPHMMDDGWAFGDGGENGDPDPLFHAEFLREVYVKADASYTGRVTVPVLWDKKTGTIVNNESRELMRMLDKRFGSIAKNAIDLAPDAQLGAIESMLDRIYNPYNNGVYRAGFATSQEAYDKAVVEVFEILDFAEKQLSQHRYLCGNTLTEADIAMYTTSIRFAPVYYFHFKCNIRRIQDYPNVWGYVRDLYQMPAFKNTTNFHHIKQHYYYSHPTINPYRIVPQGPELDLDAPHDRDRFTR